MKMAPVCFHYKGTFGQNKPFTENLYIIIFLGYLRAKRIKLAFNDNLRVSSFFSKHDVTVKKIRKIVII